MVKKLFFTDSDFVELISRDNEQALNVFYKLHFPMILNFILNNNGTVIEAKDIYQEAIIIFHSKLKEKKFTLESKLKTYIYSVCRKLWLNRLKDKDKRYLEISDFENYFPVERYDEELFIENERRFEIMSKSLNSLGEPCKTIIENFYINGKSISDLTIKMGYNNDDTTKNQKYKCLQRLKKYFFNLYKDE